MKTNDRRQRCTRCGEMADPGTGKLSSRERPDGGREWIVTHTDPCEPRQENGGPPEGSSEVPRWAVQGDGVTLAGDRFHGIRFVNGDPPDYLALPMNDSALAIAANFPPATAGKSIAHRREMMDRFGHTEESFAELGVLRAAYRRHVPTDRRRLVPEPLAVDLPDVLKREGVTDKQIDALRSTWNNGGDRPWVADTGQRN